MPLNRHVVPVRVFVLFGCAAFIALSVAGHTQDAQVASGPDPREIPVPRITTSVGRLPGVSQLPVREAMPDVMVMDGGAKVTTPRQWERRRAELKRILSYYAVGQMPPPPGNVKGREVNSER